MVTTQALICQECGTAIAKARDTPFTELLPYDARSYEVCRKTSLAKFRSTQLFLVDALVSFTLNSTHYAIDVRRILCLLAFF
jgi:hypothetical protein